MISFKNIKIKMKSLDLKIKDEFVEIFKNHIKVLNERINNKEYLDMELSDEMIQQNGLEWINKTKQIVDLSKYSNINIELEYFLIATHVKLSNQEENQNE